METRQFYKGRRLFIRLKVIRSYPADTCLYSIRIHDQYQAGQHLHDRDEEEDEWEHQPWLGGGEYESELAWPAKHCWRWFWYWFLHFLRSEDDIRSPVLSVNVGRKKKEIRSITLTKPVEFLLHHKPFRKVRKRKYVIWDFQYSSWSQDGWYVLMQKSTPTTTACQCYHLTLRPKGHSTWHLMEPTTKILKIEECGKNVWF